MESDRKIEGGGSPKGRGRASSRSLRLDTSWPVPGTLAAYPFQNSFLAEEMFYRIRQAVGPDILRFVANDAAGRFQIEPLEIERFTGGEEGDTFTRRRRIGLDTAFMEAIGIIMAEEHIGADLALQ